MSASETSTARAEPVLDVRDLTIHYRTRSGASPAVTGFNLTIMPGETVGIVGESGCGKSTIAMAIMQHLGRNGTIAGGSILFEGKDMAVMGEAELRAIRTAGIAMVYQEPFSALNPSIPCGEQLLEVVRLREPGAGAAATDVVRQMLADVNLPDPDRVMKAYPHQLSGGQLQRIVIAMALLSQPKLLLMDEPTTALDVTVEAGILELIGEIRLKFGTSILFISHNLGVVRTVCDRVCVMYSGEIVEEGEIADVFAAARHPYTRGLLAALPQPGASKHSRPLRSIPGQVMLPQQRPTGCRFAPRCSFFVEGLCNGRPGIPLHPVSGGGHAARCLRVDDISFDRPEGEQTCDAAKAPGEILLRAEKLSKVYQLPSRSLWARAKGKGKLQLRGNDRLDIEARRAETVAIVGESGSGKSTFARVVMGLEMATGGTVTLGAEEVGRLPVRKRTLAQRTSLQMVFQNPSETLNPSLTVGAQLGRVLHKFVGPLDRIALEQRVFELLDLVRLPREFAGRRPHQLSGGQKQRVAIARAFAGSPKIVVADEPVSALDVSVQAAVIELLLSIQREYETTILLISHDLAVVQYLADRVVVLYLGQIMEQGSVEEVFAPPYHPYTEALLAAVPIADPAIEKRDVVLNGPLPSPLAPPAGCAFCTRCPRRIGPICDDTAPPLQVTESGHVLRCHIPLETLREIPPVFSTKDRQTA
ncbi:UNVERIFIED_ORG: ABC transporter ATP-binding protein (plasmid) [Roseateles sp. XES5]|nr:ABC transporter ATP-binding protein [Roseateles sp. XES5]